MQLGRAGWYKTAKGRVLWSALSTYLKLRKSVDRLGPKFESHLIGSRLRLRLWRAGAGLWLDVARNGVAEWSEWSGTYLVVWTKLGLQPAHLEMALIMYWWTGCSADVTRINSDLNGEETAVPSYEFRKHK